MGEGVTPIGGLVYVAVETSELGLIRQHFENKSPGREQNFE